MSSPEAAAWCGTARRATWAQDGCGMSGLGNSSKARTVLPVLAWGQDYPRRGSLACVRGDLTLCLWVQGGGGMRVTVLDETDRCQSKCWWAGQHAPVGCWIWPWGEGMGAAWVLPAVGLAQQAAPGLAGGPAPTAFPLRPCRSWPGMLLLWLLWKLFQCVL